MAQGTQDVVWVQGPVIDSYPMGVYLLTDLMTGGRAYNFDPGLSPQISSLHDPGGDDGWDTMLSPVGRP